MFRSDGRPAGITIYFSFPTCCSFKACRSERRSFDFSLDVYGCAHRRRRTSSPRTAIRASRRCVDREKFGFGLFLLSTDETYFRCFVHDDYHISCLRLCHNQTDRISFNQIDPRAHVTSSRFFNVRTYVRMNISSIVLSRSSRRRRQHQRGPLCKEVYRNSRLGEEGERERKRSGTEKLIIEIAL